MNNLQAIRAFFESDGGRKITMDEMKALSMEDKKELGALCAEKLGVTIKTLN